MRSADLFRRFARRLLLAVAVAAFCAPALVGPGRVASAAHVKGSDEYQVIAMHLTGVLKAARAVISDSQAVFNDQTRGNKGITAMSSSRRRR